MTPKISGEVRSGRVTQLRWGSTDLAVDVAELAYAVWECDDLGRADEGEVAGVEEEDEVAAGEGLGRHPLDRPVLHVRHGREVWRRAPHPHRHRLERRHLSAHTALSPLSPFALRTSPITPHNVNALLCLLRLAAFCKSFGLHFFCLVFVVHANRILHVTITSVDPEILVLGIGSVDHLFCRAIPT